MKYTHNVFLCIHRAKRFANRKNYYANSTKRSNTIYLISTINNKPIFTLLFFVF